MPLLAPGNKLFEILRSPAAVDGRTSAAFDFDRFRELAVDALLPRLVELPNCLEDLLLSGGVPVLCCPLRLSFLFFLSSFDEDDLFPLVGNGGNAQSRLESSGEGGPFGMATGALFGALHGERRPEVVLAGEPTEP